MTRWLHERWIHFWFLPDSPTNLAVCRILFYGGVLLFYTSEHYGGWAVLPEVVYQPKSLVSRLDFLPAFSVQLLTTIEWVWKAGLFCCCIGLATRYSTVVTAICGLYLLSMPHDFGKVNHNDQPLALAMCVLAFSQCGNHLSVDSWMRKRFKTNVAPIPSKSGEYRWPVRAVWLILAFIFCAAGIAKLRFGGIEWITGNTMQYHLISHQYPFLSFPPWTDWGLTIARWPILCSVVAAASIFIELFFPLALFHPWLRLIFVTGALLMQVGIRALMGPSFEQYLFVYLFFVPWSTLLGRFSRPGVGDSLST